MEAAGRYVAPARWLHWLTAGSILVIFVTGIWMGRFEPADEAFKLALYNQHESFGVLVFVLTLARLVVRWRNPPPPLPGDMPGWMKLAATVNHGALYVLLVVQPVVGFLNTNAWGFPLRWFGLVPLPSPIGRSEALAPVLSNLHFVGAVAMAVLLAMHVGAVIQHQFIRRDGLLSRMA
jgi:cytochrome b561